MSETKKFRSALNGFNRQDVVQYIEYITNKHNSQVEQLNSQLQLALSRAADPELQTRLEAAEARIKELEEALATAEEAVKNGGTEQELEAYRRAEKTERQAKERAQQIYDQANGVLSDAALQAEEAAAKIGQIADQVAQQLQGYQQSVLETKEAFDHASQALYAIRPEETEE
jgi:type IV secretory pathway VirB4 component